MAEVKATDFTVCKIKENKDAPSNIDNVVSPRKNARMRRSIKRKEDVQESIQSFASEANEKEKTVESLNFNVDNSDEVDGKQDTKSSGIKYIVNKDSSDENKKANSKEHKRKSKSSGNKADTDLPTVIKERVEMVTKNNIDTASFEAESKLDSRKKSTDNDLKFEDKQGNFMTDEDTFKTPKNRRVSRKVTDARSSDKTGDIGNLDTNVSKSLVKAETPKNKRKGRPPKKLAAGEGISSLDSFIDTSVTVDEDNMLQDTSEVNGKDDLIKATQESKPKRKGRPKKSEVSPINSSVDETNISVIHEDDSLIFKSEINIDENITETPDNELVKHKRKGRPKKTAVSSINSSVDETNISVNQEDDSLTFRSETNISENITETPDNELVKPKRKGRPKKTAVSPINSTVDETNTSFLHEDSSFTFKSKTNITESITETPNNELVKPKRRGRPKGSVKKEKHSEVKESTGTPKPMNEGEADETDTPKSKRKTKRINYASLDEGGNDEVVESTPKPTRKRSDTREVTESAPKSSRKRKRVDYAAFSKDEDDADTDDYETPVVKRRRTKVEAKAAVPEDSDDEDTEVDEETSQKEVPVRSKEPKSGGKGKSKSKVELKCCRCEESCNSNSDMTKHMAIKHQALWTPENPEGLEDSRSLNRVIKIKKYLNCTKCGKQINFLQYYKQHLEWCGRDSETFTCPICKHEGLLAKWQDMHVRQCQRNQIQKEEVGKRSEDLKRQEEEDRQETQDGEKRKRRAAKKATTMLQNLSKDKDLELEDHLDDTDIDKDFDARASDEDEVAEEYEQDEEEEEEEEGGLSDDVGEDDFIVDTPGWERPRTSAQYWKRGSIKDEVFFFKYHITYELMKDLVKQQMSTPLYADLLPRSKDWMLVNESDSEKYLPALCHSINFTFSETADELQSLELYQSVSVQGLPMFFTGLSVWKMAWCPTLRHKQTSQYLAVVGKVDRETEFIVNTRVTAPGLIQIWDTGIQSNSLQQDSVAKFVCNIIHDYGTATDIKWCPSGCWQDEVSEVQVREIDLPDENPEVLPRMGLLACSFTDSTVRVFSIPHVPYTTDGTVPTYKPSPVVTLVPHKSWRSGNITCSCVDWQSLHGHTQIVAGYSDGTVRMFNLLTTSSLQILKPLPDKVLLPYCSFQAHYGLVRSCAWMHKFEDRVMTAGEDSSSHFWDLKDISQPFNSENTCFVPLRVINNVMLPGAITSSDNCYSINNNKTRYLDPASLWFNKDSRNLVFATTQSACIWDISYSNWLNFVLACDSRGTVDGTTWFDLSYVEGDCKTYKHRLRIAEAKVRCKIPDDSSGTNDIQCQCKSDQSESCNKCNNQSKTVCDSKSENVSQSGANVNQSDKLLESDTLTSQSEDVTQKSLESASDQSVSLRETSLNEGSKLSDLDRTLKIYDTKESQKWKHRSLLTLQSLKTNQTTQRKKSNTYSEMLEKNYLEFSEYLSGETRKPGPTLDTDFDVYDRVFINSLHTIAFNPNEHACFWVAYGGEAGLVRLVNIGSLLPRKFTDFYKLKHPE